MSQGQRRGNGKEEDEARVHGKKKYNGRDEGKGAVCGLSVGSLDESACMTVMLREVEGG